MKKIYKRDRYVFMFMIIVIIAIFTIHNCKAENVRPNDEVVLVNKELMLSHPWEEANFDIECVDSIQSENGYYWFIYDSPDQFDSVLCVSMNEKTYKKLTALLENISKNHPYIDINERLFSRFHLYYGQCEETVLMYE